MFDVERQVAGKFWPLCTGQLQPSCLISLHCGCSRQSAMHTLQLTAPCLTARPFSGRQIPVANCRRQLISRKHIASRQRVHAGIELDWSDPDTLTGAFAAVLGIVVGIGAPLFYISRDNADDKRLADLRELNRQNYKETGKYLSEASVECCNADHIRSCLSAQQLACFAGGNKANSSAKMDRPERVSG